MQKKEEKTVPSPQLCRKVGSAVRPHRAQTVWPLSAAAVYQLCMSLAHLLECLQTLD